MKYTKLKYINQYKSESINPAKTPDTIFEMYSVPIYETGHPEYLRGHEIASNKIVVQKNDILLCKINPRINRVWVVSDESDKQNIASSEWIVIRNSEYNSEFLAWYFRTPKFQKLMTSEVTGIGGSLTRAQPKYVAEYPVPVIDRKKQDKIVDVLNKCKFIIDFRQKELLELDDLIKARFVEMFGDPIQNPKGWDMPLIEEVVANEKNALKAGPFGSALKKEYYVTSGYKIYGQEQVISGDCTFGDYYIDEERYKSLENCAVQAGDVLISLVGTYGKLLIMPEVFEPGIINPRLMKITFDKEKINPYYFKFFFQSESLKRALSENTHGGTMDILNLGIVRKIAMPLPPLKLQNEFANFVKQVDKSKVAVRKSMDETQVLFEALMRRYFV